VDFHHLLLAGLPAHSAFHPTKSSGNGAAGSESSHSPAQAGSGSAPHKHPFQVLLLPLHLKCLNDVHGTTTPSPREMGSEVFNRVAPTK
jgi:hypothetical protein